MISRRRSSRMLLELRVPVPIHLSAWRFMNVPYESAPFRLPLDRFVAGRYAIDLPVLKPVSLSEWSRIK